MASAPSRRCKQDALSSFSLEWQWRPAVVSIAADLILKGIEITPDTYVELAWKIHEGWRA